MIKNLLRVFFVISFSASHAAVFSVTDTTDGTTTDGVSLRWAITQANTASTHDTILFNIPGMAPHTILLFTDLPSVYDSYLVIDGTSQPANGYPGNAPKIIINNNDTVQDGFYFFVPYNALVKGIQLSNFLEAGIYAFGSAVFMTIDSCKFNGNYDGVSVFGSLASALVQNSVLTENLHDGVYVFGASAFAMIEHNLISGNGNNGITINGGSDSSTIQGNYIGTDSSGTLPYPNVMNGILIQNNNDLIGGMNPGDGNIIAYNGADGVKIPYGNSNLITQNSMFCNAGLGINLAGSGNNNFPAPVISSATTTTVSGTATAYSRIELFYDSSCTSCQGKDYIATVYADGTGMWTFTGSLFLNSSVTATASDTASNNTSRFAVCVTVATTSINENAAESVRIFPNPARDYLTVYFKDGVDAISIFNGYGQIVMQQSVTDSHSSLQVSTKDFARGLYFLRIIGRGGDTLSRFAVAK